MTIRIFIGCSANDEDLESQLVLEYSIRKHTSPPLDITWMKLSRDPVSPFYSAPEKNAGWHTTNWATPFSGLRWAIPEVCDFQGRAIYFDSDFIVLADVGELWRAPMAPGQVVMAKGASQRYCCSLWNCAEVATHIPKLADLQKDPDSHQKMLRYFSKHRELVREFPEGSDWNVADFGAPNLLDPKTKALHYTRIDKQLQLKHALPRLQMEGRSHWYEGPAKPNHPELQRLFDALYSEAITAGGTLNQYRSGMYGRYSIRGR